MRKVDWNAMGKSSKKIIRDVKNIRSLGHYLKDIPEKGWFVDNISKNKVEIAKCKSSSLRRYVKLLDNFYYLITSEKDRNKILEKKIEIETELSTRDDGEIEKEKNQ